VFDVASSGAAADAMTGGAGSRLSSSVPLPGWILSPCLVQKCPVGRGIMRLAAGEVRVPVMADRPSI
jgi:hypothetical protein